LIREKGILPTSDPKEEEVGDPINEKWVGSPIVDPDQIKQR